MKKKKECGFSLAEALVTLLIVCLITIASIPILTKKKRNIENTGHGKWMCTLDSSGNHRYWSKSARNGEEGKPETWTKTGTDHCKFLPPNNARNFAVTVAGGGGGGAAASSESRSWTSNFAVEHPGMYNFVVIGGGGHGGGSSDKKDRSAGGGAGAVVAMKLYLSDKVSEIRMQRGVKGTCCSKRDGTKNSGNAVSDGNHSKIIGVYYNSNGLLETKTFITAEGGDGGHGGEHGGSDADRWVTPPGKVYFDIPSDLKYASYNGKSYTYQYKCYGRYGNVSCSSSSSCANDINYCSNRMYGIVLVKSSPDSSKICHGGILKKDYQVEFNSFFKNDKVSFKYPEIECSSTNNAFIRDKSYYNLSSSQRTLRDQTCNMPGLGGGSKPSRFACGADGGESSKSGSDGYVMANTTFYYSGEGGDAGDSETNTFRPKFEAKYLNVYVGKGGQGGTSSNNNGNYSGSDGARGGDTYVKDDKGNTLFYRNGGSGGSINYIKQALVDTPGGNGGNTKLYYTKTISRGVGGLSFADTTNNTNQNTSQHGLKSEGYGDGGGGGGFSVNSGGGNGAAGTNGIVIIEW